MIAQAGAKGRQLHKFGGSSLADVKCYLRVARALWRSTFSLTI
ncbi:hypothetical protein ACLB1S_01065 [Escherichia coli]